ncbi:GTP-binding protein 1-like [Scleropages formosus]|uniref:GTP-binding protein 1-like n=1 Tax=Scleropages formosus TaxID=113540 RepID=A0A0N8JZY3_SCLFO|nr:GTP-binding protein 1-like [Scleropages formosus]
MALVSVSGQRYESLLRQLRQQMEEGCRENACVVGLGSDVADYRLSEADREPPVATVQSLSEQLGTDLVLLWEGIEAQAVVGCADAGMGTLLDVLTHGEWNNEHGFTCQVLFHHMHEIESGHTISVGNDIMCFDLEGQVVNKPDIHGGTLDQNLREAFRLFGVMDHLPDFCKLMVESNAGIVGLKRRTWVLPSPSILCPIFYISNVTGENTDLLKTFLNLLSSWRSQSDEKPAEVRIDDTYSGMGGLVSDTLLHGLISFSDTLLLSLYLLGNFAVKSIHSRRMLIRRSSIRKGVVMVSLKLSPQAFWEFDAEVLELHHLTCTVAAATILSMNHPNATAKMPADERLDHCALPLHQDPRLLYPTNNLPSASKLPQIKMRSTKTALTRKEDASV